LNWTSISHVNLVVACGP